MDLVAFGSVARGSSRPDSDLDLLVTFAPDAPWDAGGYCVALREELADLFGRTVELIEENAIRASMTERRLSCATTSVLYAA